ncbi:MAG: bifunctional 3-(3-hydroxy-phenyl)propionate/3-hydroxycinnamic acid hydroxylase [Acidobacteriota bacterium]
MNARDGKSPMRRADVVVVGLGPVGTLLTHLLGRRGWRVMAFDRLRSIVDLPRAVHFDAEAMRVFQAAGVARVLRASLRPVRGMHFLNEAGQLIYRFDAEAGFGPLGWHQGYMFHQPDLDRVLRTAASGVPDVELVLGQEVLTSETSESGVVVKSRGAHGDLAVAARYVVWCSGAGNGSRRPFESGVHDFEFDQTWLAIDVLLDSPALLPDTTVQYCEIPRPSTYVRLPGNRRRFEVRVLPGESPERFLSDSAIDAFLQRWLPAGGYRVERATAYTFHALVAERWRSGRALIAGDAAHQMPPLLGQGLCAGIRDVANLEWKLDAVLRRQARPSLLDTYRSERQPHVRAILRDALALGVEIHRADASSARSRDTEALASGAATRLEPRWYPVGDGLCTQAAPARFPFPQPLLADGRRHDRRLSSGFAFIGPRRFAAAVEARLGGLGVVQIHDPEPAIRDWLAAHDVTLVVVRPDRLVLGVGSSLDDLETILRPLAVHLDGIPDTDDSTAVRLRSSTSVT